MRFDATGRTGPKPPSGTRVFDMDTGEEVRTVIWLDYDPATGLGTLEAYLYREGVGIVREMGEDGVLYNKKYTARGRFRVVRGGRQDGRAGGANSRVAEPKPTATVVGQPVPNVVMGAPSCARCKSPLTIPGDDLCPACRAADRGQRNRMRPAPDDSPMGLHPCEDCGALATHSVSDEVTATPAVGRIWLAGNTRKVLFDRAATVGRRYYCARCYKPPRQLDPKGEVMQEFDNDPVRPT